MNQTDHLFVYGSLQQKAGHPAHKVLAAHACYLGDAVMRGKLYLVEDYPGAVASDAPDELVRGELYRIENTEAIFKKLDRYEDYDPSRPAQSLYLRERRPVFSEGATVEAWVYLFNRPVAQLEKIPSGDYLNHTS